MIHKIVKIKNLGRFSNPYFGKDNWNGILEKNNVIFANNGNGKTTLSLLFRSLKGQNALLLKKRTFNSVEGIEIEILDETKRSYNYKRNRWNKHFPNIEIFDSFYVEDNVYIITIKDSQSSHNIFEVLLGEESVSLRKEIELLTEKLTRLKNKRINLRSRRNKELDADKKEELNQQMLMNTDARKVIRNRISELEKQILNLSGKYKDEYLEKINFYLKYFNPNLKLSQLTQHNSKVIYNLEISGYKIADKEYSLKYSLSEGDKNSLSLSFFFAKLDI